MTVKSFPTQILAIAKSGAHGRNVRALLKFLLVLAVMILTYTVLFHLLMLREGQRHTWLTGLYWTLTVMSTLGFGDITFHTDLGRAFSILVLLSGMVFMLVLLPFTFIQFFYEPWMAAQAASRAPRRVPDDVRGHVLLTNVDAVTTTLVRRLTNRHRRHFVIVDDTDEAIRLGDFGFSVVVGDRDDPETYRRAGVERAALVVATGTDVANSHVAFTVREVSASVPIVCTADQPESVDVLELAGAAHVLELPQMMGRSFARWTLGGEAESNVIHHIEGVLIAEASPFDTPLVGKTLAESQLRRDVGVTVVGVWERGRFRPALPDTKITQHTVLVLAGTKASLARYDEKFRAFNRPDTPVVILGGGRVGAATARALASAKLDYRIVEKSAEQRPINEERLVRGDAADLEVLKAAGIDGASTVIITTHDDDVNVYLALYCRKLRPNIQIIARATSERNVSTLHRAGADLVLSNASLGSNAIINLIERDRVLMLVEGLDLFQVRVPPSIAGKTLIEAAIRARTGCSVVAVKTEEGMRVGPRPEEVLDADAELLLIGTVDAQETFLAEYGKELTD